MNEGTAGPHAVQLSFAGPDEGLRDFEGTYDIPGLTVRIETATPPPWSAPLSSAQSMDHSLLSPPTPARKHRAPRPPTTQPTDIIITFPEDTLPVRQSVQTEPSAYARTKDTVEVSVPPPPLFRPTTFWRNAKRSGVTGSSYSPGTYVVRRSTFLAAGLTLDNPVSDLSAFGVESRVGFVVLPDTDIELYRRE